MSNKWEPDWDAYVRYNIEDARLSKLLRERLYTKTAKENLMRLLNNSNETQNAQIR